jgi:DNA-binding MarR family transcriptional regulator
MNGSKPQRFSISKIKNLPPMLLPDVYKAPGHLIRRAQQIGVAIFFEEFDGWDVTPVQYAALIAIRDRPGMEQRTLVNYIAIDRSTVGSMSKGLEERKLIYRVTPKENQRIKQLFIKPAGERLLDDTRNIIARVQERILAPLDKKDQAVFMELLTRLVKLNNELSRAPLRILD